MKCILTCWCETVYHCHNFSLQMITKHKVQLMLMGMSLVLEVFDLMLPLDLNSGDHQSYSYGGHGFHHFRHFFQNHKCQLHGGTREKAKFTKVIGIYCLGTWMSVQYFMAILPTVVGIFHFGSKWWTNQPTDIVIFWAIPHGKQLWQACLQSWPKTTSGIWPTIWEIFN